MADAKLGVEVKDHRFVLKTFKATFVASEAIAWLLADGHAKSRAEAIKMGQQMLEAHLISAASHTGPPSSTSRPQVLIFFRGQVR